MTIGFHLLGGFRLVVAGRDVPESAWGRRKARAVVKLLALAPGRALHRDQLLDTLWPDLSSRAAANSLYQAIHVARRAFAAAGVPGERSLTYAGEVLRLAPHLAIVVDVEEFEAAAAQARTKGDGSS